MPYNPYKNLDNPYDYDEQLLKEYLSGKKGSVDSTWKKSRARARNYEAYVNYMNWEHDREMAAADYEANSYPLQVAQMLKAGLNPDLMSDVNPGTMSSETSEYNPISLQQEANSIARGNQVISALGTVGQTLLQSFHAYMNFKQVQAQVDIAKQTSRGLNLDNIDKEQQFMLDYALQNVDAEFLERWTHDDGRSDESLSFQHILESFQNVLNPDLLSERTGLDIDTARRLTANWSHRYSSPESLAQLYSKLAEYSKSRQQYMSDISSPTWSDTYVPNDYMEAQSKLSYDVYMFSQKWSADYWRALSASDKAGAENSQNAFTRDYYNELDPVVKATSDNREFDFKGDAAEIKNYLQKVAFSYLKSPDYYCQLQGQQILQWLSSGQWMNERQFIVAFANRFVDMTENLRTDPFNSDSQYLNNFTPFNSENLDF